MTRPKPRPSNLTGPQEVDVPSVHLKEITPGLSRRADGQLALYLRVVMDGDDLGEDSVRELLLELAHTTETGVGGIDPYNTAASLMGAADSLVRLDALERGIETQQLEAYLRGKRREAKLRRHQETDEIIAVSKCEYCNRPVAFIEDGVKLCKRHAEELGVRPKGKVQ